MKESPRPVDDERLYSAFLQRHSYQKQEHELAVNITLKNYISRLRHDIGPVLGARVSRWRSSGYAYDAAAPAGKVYLK